MTKNNVDRRRRLVLGGLVALAGSLYAVAVGRGVLKACGIDELDMGAAELRPLIRIGDAYLDEVAKAQELSALHDKLLNGVPTAPDQLVGQLRRCLLTIGRVAQEEFRSGDTVVCDGWVLAKSEAQFCAMAALGFRRSKFAG
jgi:hypothetical protein